MKKSKIVLSFDDGRIDNIRAAREILVKCNVPATFNITTGYIDQSISKVNCPSTSLSLNKNDLDYLIKNGFEIASHGDQHLNDIDDIRNSVNKIHEIFKLDSEIGFASPNSLLNYSAFIQNKELLESFGIKYVRTGLNDDKKILPRILRKISNLSGTSFFFKLSLYNYKLLEMNTSFFYSIPITKKTTLKQLIDLLKYFSNKNKDCILMFHSILQKGEELYNDNWSWDYDDFRELCLFLNNNDSIEVVTNYDLYKLRVLGDK